MISYSVFDNKTGLSKLFNADLNSSKQLKQSFAIKAITSMQTILAEFIDKINNDERLPNVKITKEDQDLVKKEITRFAIYIMVFNYSQLLRYIFAFFKIIKKHDIPNDLLVEYHMFFSSRFDQWALENFGLNVSEQFFYRRKLDSLLYLATQIDALDLMPTLEEILDSIPANTNVDTQMIEINIFAALEERITKESLPNLISLLKNYLLSLQQLNQKGCDKIAMVLAKTILTIDQNKGIFIGNKNSHALLRDLMEKFASYTSDEEFGQAPLSLHYLDIQIELTLLRVFIKP